MTKGWHYESGRHSLAARGIPTSHVIKKLMNAPFRYGLYLDSAFEHIRLKDQEMSMSEYYAFKNFVIDMKEQGKITDLEIASIDREYGHIIGVPLLTDWGLQITEEGRLEGTTFEIHEDHKEVAEGKIIFLDITGEAIDWSDEKVYENRDTVLASIENADLEFEWTGTDYDRNRYEFLKNSMPFILKLARAEGVNLEFSELFSDKEIQLLKKQGFKVKYTRKTPIGKMTRMIYYRN
jgi:hypothetical protein